MYNNKYINQLIIISLLILMFDYVKSMYYDKMNDLQQQYVTSDNCKDYINYLNRNISIINEIKEISTTFQNIDITQTCDIVLSYAVETIDTLKNCNKIILETEQVPFLLYQIKCNQWTVYDEETYHDIITNLNGIIIPESYPDNFKSHQKILQDKLKNEPTLEHIIVLEHKYPKIDCYIQNSKNMIELLDELITLVEQIKSEN